MSPAGRRRGRAEKPSGAAAVVTIAVASVSWAVAGERPNEGACP